MILGGTKQSFKPSMKEIGDNHRKQIPIYLVWLFARFYSEEEFIERMQEAHK